MPRAPHLLHGYGVLGLALVGNMLRDAYVRARDVCELFPQFDFTHTFREEIQLHHTRLPGVQVHVSTILLVAAFVLSYIAMSCRLVELAWLAAVEFASFRWLGTLIYVHLPAWLPFLASEPGVPDLLSDGEDDGDRTDDGLDGSSPTACVAAMDKLVQVKLQHANCTITRPDGWLVFDPEKETLVTKKQYDASRRRSTLPVAAFAEQENTANGYMDDDDEVAGDDHPEASGVTLDGDRDEQPEDDGTVDTTDDELQDEQALRKR